jgi:hypothetical protein
VYNSITTDTFTIPSFGGQSPTINQMAGLLSLNGDNGFWSGVLSAGVSGANMVLSYSGASYGANKSSTNLTVTLPDIAYYSGNGIDKYTPSSNGGGVSKTIAVNYLYKANVSSVAPLSVNSGSVATFSINLEKPLPPSQNPATVLVTFGAGISAPSSVTPILNNGWLQGWSVTAEIPLTSVSVQSVMHVKITGVISYLGGSSPVQNNVTYYDKDAATITVVPSAVVTHDAFLASFDTSEPWVASPAYPLTQDLGPSAGFTSIKATCVNSAVATLSLAYASPTSLLTGSDNLDSDVFSLSIKSQFGAATPPTAYGLVLFDTSGRSASWGCTSSYFPVRQESGRWITFSLPRKVTNSSDPEVGTKGLQFYGNPAFDWSSVANFRIVFSAPANSIFWFGGGVFTPAS